MNQTRKGNADTVIVLDFETTGMSPELGDRAIEIGAVRIEGGRITERFQGLMNPGRRISPFIEDFTGITDKMLRSAEFSAGYDLVAHNAGFDRRFLLAELQHIRRRCSAQFACSMLLARRLYPEAPNHKLGTLVAYKQLPNDGTFHRALADAEMTAHLWLGMLGEITERHRITQIPFALTQELGRVAKRAVPEFLKRWKATQANVCA
jgi:DNA polymerase-3 subunit epsilon